VQDSDWEFYPDEGFNVVGSYDYCLEIEATVDFSQLEIKF